MKRNRNIKKKINNNVYIHTFIFYNKRNNERRSALGLR